MAPTGGTRVAESTHPDLWITFRFSFVYNYLLLWITLSYLILYTLL